MALVLHSGEGNKNAYKALIAAEYCGVNIEHVKEYQMGDSGKTHLFLENAIFGDRNDFGKIPVLETPDGLIVESNAMARYVAMQGHDKTLWGPPAYKLAKIEQWMAYTTRDIDVVLKKWADLRMNPYPHNAIAEHVVRVCVKRALHLLNAHLDPDNVYLVGDSITLADIVMTCDLYYGFTRVMAKSFTSKFPHVERYFWNLVNQPNFKKFLGEVKQVESLPDMEPPPELYVSPEMDVELKKLNVYQMVELQYEGERINQLVDLQNEGERINQLV